MTGSALPETGVVKLLLASLAVALCLLGGFKVARAAELNYKPLPEFGLAAGAAFPLNRLMDPYGHAIAQEHLTGKRWLLINFYTKHCAPCIKEVPKLNQVKERRSDIHVLAITPDSGDEAASYVKQHGLNWRVAANAGPLLFKHLNLAAFPAFALLDARGRLVATVQANQLGGDDGHATVAGIEAWLDGQAGKTVK